LFAATLSAPQFALPLRPFSASPALAKSGRHGKKVTHDPYLLAQQARKKAANLSRRADIEAVRVASLGDPVRGNTTPFVESFASASPIQWEEGKKAPRDKTHLNYALRPYMVDQQLRKSEQVAIPLDELKAKAGAVASNSTESQYPWSQHIKYPAGLDQWGSSAPAEPKEEVDVEAQRQKDHERATEAIKRITALENGSSKDRMRVNVARCVSTFGRHNTDRIIPPRAPPLPAVNATQAHAIRPKTNIKETRKRVGPDTGSSEVQIAILTAKIKTLADFLETRGKGDKHNKRNLRLLVHRRQKLLQYLRRKERGGPRWQHCIETLGLTEGTWRGEISL
jgi:ribosomal protein S15